MLSEAEYTRYAESYLDMVFRVAFKPTPSIAREQETVSVQGEEQTIEIHGRHDPVIVPRAVVVVESMAALIVADLLLLNATARMDNIKKGDKIYIKKLEDHFHQTILLPTLAYLYNLKSSNSHPNNKLYLFHLILKLIL